MPKVKFLFLLFAINLNFNCVNFRKTIKYSVLTALPIIISYFITKNKYELSLNAFFNKVKGFSEVRVKIENQLELENIDKATKFIKFIPIKLNNKLITIGGAIKKIKKYLEKKKFVEEMPSENKIKKKIYIIVPKKKEQELNSKKELNFQKEEIIKADAYIQNRQFFVNINNQAGCALNFNYSNFKKKIYEKYVLKDTPFQKTKENKFFNAHKDKIEVIDQFVNANNIDTNNVNQLNDTLYQVLDANQNKKEEIKIQCFLSEEKNKFPKEEDKFIEIIGKSNLTIQIDVFLEDKNENNESFKDKLKNLNISFEDYDLYEFGTENINQIIQ